VNTVGPGGITNRMDRGLHTEERIAAMRRNVPLTRVVEPEDIAHACMFRARARARAIIRCLPAGRLWLSRRPRAIVARLFRAARRALLTRRRAEFFKSAREDDMDETFGEKIVFETPDRSRRDEAEVARTQTVALASQ
jgi:hypothetical protein